MKNRLHRMISDSRDRTAAAALVSLGVNALTGAGKLVLGLYLLSPWFITNAVYYLVLGAARGLTLRRYAQVRTVADPEKRHGLELAVYQKSGFFLCLLGLSYMAVCLRMLMAGDVAVFGGNIVFLIALVAFSKLATAIHGNVVNRHLKSPVVSALKIINFTDAVVSIVVTQYTLLVMTGSAHAISSSAWFGMGCSLLFILTGIFMLCKRKVRRMPEPGMADEGPPNLNHAEETE